MAKLSTATQVTIDLSQEQAAGNLSFVQSLYIDNSGNGATIAIVCRDTNQNIIVQAGKQAYMPVLSANPPFYTISSAGGVDVPIFFLNFFMPPIVF